MSEIIELELDVFVSDRNEAIGVLRGILLNGRTELVISVENARHFIVPLTAVETVHSQKLILNFGRLESRLREAIGLDRQPPPAPRDHGHPSPPESVLGA